MTDIYNEEDKPICGCCDEALLNDGCGMMVNRGCCSDGDCDKQIEALCGECGTWDEEDQVWRCPDCQEKHENNDYCPACNELTNTKNYCGSRTCCVCLEMTFCEKCVKDYEDKDCSHEWKTHCVCVKCAGDYKKEDKHEAEWEEVYNSTDIMKGEAREYCEQPGKFYQTYGNGGGKNGSGGYWIRDGSAGVWSVAGETFTYLKDATVEYRNQRSMSGICAAIRVNVDVNPPEADGDGSDDE